MWTNWLGRFWAAIWATDIKWTDIALVLFTFGLVWVGFRQARILRRQTEIAAETREIALAALGRPYLFVELEPHNLNDWREGEDYLRFLFRITNHGIGPAIINGIFAYAFLSRGPGERSRNEESHVIRAFPDEEDIIPVLQESVVEVGADGTRQWRVRHPLTIAAGQTSAVFRALMTAGPLPDEPRHASLQNLYSVTKNAFPVAPWLIGRVIYKDTFGRVYKTSFCLRGDASGGATEECGPPYNERT